MTDARDPFDALREPPQPVAPDPTFADDLRARVERALDQGADVTAMTRTVPIRELTWPPTLAPYLGVGDGRRAIDWYVEVFDGHLRGDVAVMPDGSIGHAEVGIGDAVLMLAEYGSGEAGDGGPAHTVDVRVPDAHATVDRAIGHGATLELPVTDGAYGRTGVFVDPFGHRWMVMTTPTATRVAPGDVAYITIAVPDDERRATSTGRSWAGRPRLAGSSGVGRSTRDPAIGLWGGAERPAAQLCFRVTDLDAALRRVRELGGQANEPTTEPYGRWADCRDDQGLRFQLFEAPAS